MSYIGNDNITQGFIPAVDFFSGNGSTTAFTLSRPVASVAQVQANISNVPQNPGSAYTVSGNTITFTSAPPSGTNNIYVYYTSPITQVIAPGQGTVTSSSFGTITDFTTTGNTILGDASTDTLNVGNGGLVKDASGNVGIGTALPGYKLDVSGVVSSNDTVRVTSGTTVTIMSTAGGGEGVVGTSSNHALQFRTNNTERMRIASTGELTYTKSTLASYVWSGFNPTNVTGTVTNAPATGTIYDTNYVTMANSSGTVTTTFDIAGSYLVTVCVDTKHGQAYTFERTNFNLGGTATRTSPVNQIVFNGIDSNDADTSASISFLVTATAGQTITILPTYELTGGGTTANHTCYPYITTMYCGG